MASMSSSRIVFLVVLLFVSTSLAAQVAPIWLSPTNVKYDAPEDVAEQFPERGVWSNITVGAGGRSKIPLFVMDSKKTLWIAFGVSPYSYLTTVWNYDPKTDLYRWVAGPGNLTTNLRNPGELGVPSPDNAPGQVWAHPATIDHNDNIWFLSEYYCCEFWMFNTTSYMFTRIQSGQSDSNYGTPGQPGQDVYPGDIEQGCFVTDSLNNLWLISGTNYNPFNHVWHFNTTSLQWTFISGNTSFVQTVYGDSPFYGGREAPGCDIDENDRVWLFGGLSTQPEGSFSDVWSFDTRTTQWQLERGSNASFNNNAKIVSNDYHPDNVPQARESATLVNRKDGTLIMACGQGQNDVWLFNKTSKQWKLVYGEPNFNFLIGSLAGNFSHYRTPGSAMPGRSEHGYINGLNVDGDVFMLGGSNSNVSYSMKDIWLIPFDQCANNATYKCEANEQCVEEMIGYSCMAITQPPVQPTPEAVPNTSPHAKVSGGLTMEFSFVVLSLLAIFTL